VIDDAVQRWFRELRSKTIQHSKEKGIIFKDMIKFLETRVLIVNPRQRRATKAKDVELQLIEEYKAYKVMEPTEPRSTKNPSSFLSGKFPRRRNPEKVVQGTNWEISLPDAAPDLKTGSFSRRQIHCLCPEESGEARKWITLHLSHGPTSYHE
jgi:hypothetical protein